MSYRKVEMYSLFCDSCGKMFSDDNGFCAWSDSHMDDHEEYEWYDHENKHYCPACHTKPELLPEPDLTDLRDTVKGYIDYVDSPDYHEDNDYRQYIFEAAVMALYGKDVWKWINDKT